MEKRYRNKIIIIIIIISHLKFIFFIKVQVMAGGYYSSLEIHFCFKNRDQNMWTMFQFSVFSHIEI